MNNFNINSCVKFIIVGVFIKLIISIYLALELQTLTLFILVAIKRDVLIVQRPD